MKDKIALVTGATSGIGKEIVKQLLLNGAKVVMNYGSNETQAKKAVEELKEHKENVLLVKANISNEEEVKEMFNLVKEKFGKLDYLVNNAGTNVDDFIEDLNIDNFKMVLNTNLVGKVICTKYAIPLLKNSNSASIVNISSNLGIKPCAESSAYCSAAAGIINFTEVSALELSKYKIRVNTICPGFTPTPLSLSGWTKEEIAEKEKNALLGRLGETSDMANGVLFLLSDKASYINGINLPINGGSLLKK